MILRILKTIKLSFSLRSKNYFEGLHVVRILMKLLLARYVYLSFPTTIGNPVWIPHQVFDREAQTESVRDDNVADHKKKHLRRD